jgi:MFS family permease
LSATFSTFFYPARDSLIPHIVTAEELSGANSAISISGQMSHLLGPLFAGIGISIFGLRHLFTADAISFLFSILFISLIIDPARKLAIKKHPPKWQGIIEGLTYVKSNKGLRLLLILTFVNNLFIMGPAIIGLPVFVREVLTSDFGVLAKLEVAMASGMLMGSFVFWKAEKNISPISILLFGIVMDGITYTLLFFADTSSIAILVLVVHGIGIPLITVSRTTQTQIAMDEVSAKNNNV